MFADMSSIIDQSRSQSIQEQTDYRSGVGGVGLVWLARAGLQISPWWSPQRDIELANFWKKPDHLAGAVYTLEARMTSIPFRIEARDPSVSEHVRQADQLTREHETIGFEMILPTFSNGCRELGFALPQAMVERYNAMRAEKLSKIQSDLLYSRHTTLAFSVEFMGDDFGVEKARSLQECDGSVAGGDCLGVPSFGSWIQEETVTVAPKETKTISPQLFSNYLVPKWFAIASLPLFARMERSGPGALVRAEHLVQVRCSQVIFLFRHVEFTTLLLSISLPGLQCLRTLVETYTCVSSPWSKIPYSWNPPIILFLTN